MKYIIGSILALSVAALAYAIGFDGDRAFYPTVVMVIASYYILFAAIGASSQILLAEIVVASAFSLLAVIGFKASLWWVVVAIVGHGVFDFGHDWLIKNPGVPLWWPGFCLAFDVTFGGLMGVRLLKRTVS